MTSTCNKMRLVSLRRDKLKTWCKCAMYKLLVYVSTAEFGLVQTEVDGRIAGRALVFSDGGTCRGG